MKLNHRDTETIRKPITPQMNTDKHGSENQMVLIRVHPCSSVANSSFAFLCVSVVNFVFEPPFALPETPVESAPAPQAPARSRIAFARAQSRPITRKRPRLVSRRANLGRSR